MEILRSYSTVHNPPPQQLLFCPPVEQSSPRVLAAQHRQSLRQAGQSVSTLSSFGESLTDAFDSSTEKYAVAEATPAVGGFSIVGAKQLIVNYLSPKVSDDELHAIFEEFGEVERARTNYNFKTGASRGYGFVYFARAQDAADAVRKLDGFELYGRSIHVGFASPQRPPSAVSQMTKTRPLYMGPRKDKDCDKLN